MDWANLDAQLMGYLQPLALLVDERSDEASSSPMPWRFARGKPDALLHHSDRGSQYTSEQFQRVMADNGAVCSMRTCHPNRVQAARLFLMVD